MDFVNKPKSTEFEKFNITLHDDGRVLYTKYDVKAVIAPEERASGRSRQTNFDVMEEAAIIKKNNLHLEPNEVSYFFLIFHIPENLCRFGEPLACHFIDEDIEVEEEPREPSTADSELTKTNKKKKKKLERATEYDISRNTKLFNKNIYKPSLSAVLRTSLARPSILPGIIVRNFPLSNGPLTARQKDEMQHHCLPRMLSSLKFPIEFAMEKSESAKKRGNLYLRRHGKDEDATPMEPEYFNYEKQEAPERLYPYFDKRFKIIYNDADEDSPMPINYHGETLYSMLHTLQDIQGKYQNRSTIFLEQQAYNPKLAIPDQQKSSIQSAFSRQSTAQANRITIISQKVLDSKNDRYSKESKIVRVTDTGLVRDSTWPSFVSTEPEQQILAEIAEMSRRFTNEISDNLVIEEPPPPKKTFHVKHWTTKHIKKMEFNREKLTVTIKTDRLGLFGFAYKRYAHFPFSDWRLQQNEEK